MYAVVNRLRLKHPIDPEVFAAAQRDLPPRAAQIDGLHAFHALRVGDNELVLIIIGDSEPRSTGCAARPGTTG